MITVDINDAEVQAMLERVSDVLADMSPVFNQIGLYLVRTTKERFPTGKAPDGTPWAPRSAATLNNYERLAKKPGKQASWGGVLHYSGQLSKNINHQYSPDWVRVGSPEPWAAMMQFGGTKSKWPHLWGNIPARPFLGMSDEDKQGVMDIATEALQAALQP